MSISNPTLSICIPTYNRADLLRSALWSLVDQAKLAGERVQIIVSDNCSTDATPEVVKWAQQYIPVRYHRQPRNLGAIANILGLISDLADGEFCWILGDDDLVRPGAVRRVLDAIQAHPDIDYVFVNHSYEFIAERKNRGTLVTGADFSELRNLLCRESSDGLVEHWEDIIYFSDVPALFTSLVSHVFRRSSWNANPILLGNAQLFDSLETTFPHACIIARMMVGKPAYFIGFPMVILFTGTQEWFSRWPEILFLRVLELSDLFQSVGVAQSLVDYYRNTLFNGSSEQWRLLCRRNFKTWLPILWRLIVRYGNYPSLWKMFLSALKRVM